MTVSLKDDGFKNPHYRRWIVFALMALIIYLIDKLKLKVEESLQKHFDGSLDLATSSCFHNTFD